MKLIKNTDCSGVNSSPRQLEILQLLNAGESNIAVSERLGFSQSTVEQELQRITKRLRERNRSEAVARAIEFNLMSHQGEVKTPIATMNKNELSVESESASRLKRPSVWSVRFY